MWVGRGPVPEVRPPPHISSAWPLDTSNGIARTNAAKTLSTPSLGQSPRAGRYSTTADQCCPQSAWRQGPAAGKLRPRCHGPLGLDVRSWRAAVLHLSVVRRPPPPPGSCPWPHAALPATPPPTAAQPPQSQCDSRPSLAASHHRTEPPLASSPQPRIGQGGAVRRSVKQVPLKHGANSHRPCAAAGPIYPPCHYIWNEAS